MKPLGDIIKSALSPIVKGTTYEHCEECEKRKKSINNWWTNLVIRVKQLVKNGRRS